MRDRYFTPTEVATHNCESDVWVSFLGRVYNLTPLIKRHEGDPLTKPILGQAGKDVSHWFDKDTGDVKTHVDPVTGCRVAYTPRGRFLHVPPPTPRSDWNSSFGTPWWKDLSACVGRLTTRVRKVRITNMLTGDAQTIEVCTEEILSEIQTRYHTFNSHTEHYTWKHAGKLLDMSKTLSDNGIADQTDELFKLSLDDDHESSIPELHLYFNDDLSAK